LTPAASLLAQLDALRKALARVSSPQVFASAAKSQMHETASSYFSNVQPSLGDLPAEELNQIFQAIHASSRINPSTQKCRELVKRARKLLIALEGQSLSVTRKQSTASPTDELIVTSLNDICPSASLAYQQALIDFKRGDRMSWRGPATDLREALREALDVLAPDSQVQASPGFKLEGDAKRPTMKQKVRHVLKSRGTPSGAMETPESAVTGIEDLVGGLTRSVYTRSSVSTHTATTQAEASRVLAWVRLVLCELLEIPLV
jgi:Predicted pPIWI-associating nuclease